MKAKTEAIGISYFFVAINYRESVIVPRQIPCHFSPSTILSARNSAQRSVIPSVSAEINIFARAE